MRIHTILRYIFGSTRIQCRIRIVHVSVGLRNTQTSLLEEKNPCEHPDWTGSDMSVSAEPTKETLAYQMGHKLIGYCCNHERCAMCAVKRCMCVRAGILIPLCRFIAWWRQLTCTLQNYLGTRQAVNTTHQSLSLQCTNDTKCSTVRNSVQWSPILHPTLCVSIYDTLQGSNYCRFNISLFCVAYFRLLDFVSIVFTSYFSDDITNWQLKVAFEMTLCVSWSRCVMYSIVGDCLVIAGFASRRPKSFCRCSLEASTFSIFPGFLLSSSLWHSHRRLHRSYHVHLMSSSHHKLPRSAIEPTTIIVKSVVIREIKFQQKLLCSARVLGTANMRVLIFLVLVL